ncbi:hypothetical protein Enr13x_22530 [Stieleria neptunia]|uniref:Uncharacterized protein n=1 Tax=Stieleria neptunia TaxID=2527979 RepID=A0A518HNJ4_9BACT|nr:hypothetical protein [Stieleria neptunia]QDV42408.1 hypothetical protein Enr13x_22530 [Stieleria neptunia]
MDFWDHLFDSDYKRRADIEKLKRAARRRVAARSHEIQQVDQQAKRIDQLEQNVGELALLCRSLLTVLRENRLVEPEQFQEVMDRIDAEDGVVDGMVTPQEPPDDPSQPPEIRAW